MNLALQFRHLIGKVSQALVEELDALVANINIGFAADHNPDGHHKWVYEKTRDLPMGYWKRYQPGWYSSGATDPVIGNGSLRGGYTQIGETVFYQIKMIAGSTTTFGTAGQQWRFTLPFSHQWEESNNFEVCLGTGWAFDSSAGFFYTLDANINITLASAPEGLVPVYNVGASVVTPTVPFTWASGDYVFLRGFYRRVIEPTDV